MIPAVHTGKFYTRGEINDSLPHVLLSTSHHTQLLLSGMSRDRHRWRSEELECSTPSSEALTQIPLPSGWQIQHRGKTKAKHLCLQAQLLQPGGFLLEEQSVCHKGLKMSRRGLRSAPWKLLTALYQSLELLRPLKLISSRGNDLLSYS